MSELPSAPPRGAPRALRHWVTVAVLLATTAVSLVGLAQALRAPRSAGDAFDRAEFHARLASADLDQLTDAQLEELTRLLERDVAQGRVWTPEPLPSKQQGPFHRNFDALAAQWLRLQAADFVRLEGEQRLNFGRRRASPLRRLLRAANYLDMRALTILSGAQPPQAITDLPPQWVHEELQRWERMAPRDARDDVRQFRSVMEPHVNRGRRMPD